MTPSIFSQLPNILIMDIIKMNTESERIALTKKQMSTCFPFIENNHLYGWLPSHGETPFDDNVDSDMAELFGVEELDLFHKDDKKFIQVWGFTSDDADTMKLPL